MADAARRMLRGMEAQDVARRVLAEAILEAQDCTHLRAQEVLLELTVRFLTLSVQRHDAVAFLQLADQASAVRGRLRAGSWSVD